MSSASRPDPGGPVDALLNSWADHPSGLGDMSRERPALHALRPVRCARRARRKVVGFCLVTLVGAALSTSMELLQFYDADRVTSLWDVASNASEQCLGPRPGCWSERRPSVPLLRQITANPVPSLLLIAMLGYRLVPYVPVIDLHKYWTALKPLLSGPLPAPVDVFHYFALWVTASELLAEIFGAAPSLLLAPLLVGFVLAAKVAIYASVLTRAELAGAGLAVLVGLADPAPQPRPGCHGGAAAAGQRRHRPARSLSRSSPKPHAPSAGFPSARSLAGPCWSTPRRFARRCFATGACSGSGSVPGCDPGRPFYSSARLC